MTMSLKARIGVATIIVLMTTAVADAVATPSGNTHRPGKPPAVSVSASLDELRITPGRPCLPSELSVGMTNNRDTATYADTLIRASGPIEVDRQVFSSWLPPGQQVTAPVLVTTPYGTQPEESTISLQSGRSHLVMPVDILAPPALQPGDNLLLGRAASASSTYPGNVVCGAVEGERVYWSSTTGWASASREPFPQYYAVELSEPTSIDRVDLYTINTGNFPSDEYGLRDWDVQIRADEQWQTVSEIRGNTSALMRSRFEPVLASAVRIVCLNSNDASNPAARITELEVPLPGRPPGGNLLLNGHASASSTYSTYSIYGPLDGDRTTWSGATAWADATSWTFPDEYTVTLPEATTIGRVDLYTIDIPDWPADEHGLRDWDVQVQVNGEWATVAQVRENTTAHVRSTFDPVQGTGVRIVALDANFGKYSRITELEAYAG